MSKLLSKYEMWLHNSQANNEWIHKSTNLARSVPSYFYIAKMSKHWSQSKGLFTSVTDPCLDAVIFKPTNMKNFTEMRDNILLGHGFS